MVLERHDRAVRGSSSTLDHALVRLREVVVERGGEPVERRPHREASDGAPDDDRADAGFRTLAERQQGAAVDDFRRRRALWLSTLVVRLAYVHSECLFGFRRAVREQVEEVLRDSCSE